MDTRPSFLADAMLGRLCKWLRVLGWDTSYIKNKPTIDLLRTAETEGRILLTRRQDIENASLVFMKSERLEEQLQQLEILFSVVTNAKPFSRCIECNSELQLIDKEEVKDKVPFFTCRTQKEFYICPSCGKVFWPGSHHDAMLKKIKELSNRER
jgi:uncharacterized protein with PIN domain